MRERLTMNDGGSTFLQAAVDVVRRKGFKKKKRGCAISRKQKTQNYAGALSQATLASHGEAA